MSVKSLEQIREEGRERGKRIASWIEVPKPGTTFFTYRVTDRESAREAMYAIAVKAEDTNRRFPEFEATRYALNTHPESIQAWEAYSDGVVSAIREQVDAAIRAAGKHYWET